MRSGRRWVRRADQKRAIASGNTYSALYFSCRTGYPYVNSSPTEEPVMDSIAQLVPGFADDRRPRGSVIGVTIPLPRYLVTSRTARAGRLTVRR